MRFVILIAIASLIFAIPPAGAQSNGKRWWSNAADHALQLAGPNRKELVKALIEAPINEREGIQFLIENMPESDLKSLTAAYLMENTHIAYEALANAPWRDTISKSLFFNEILPYACLNEKRDDSRRFLRDKAEPLIAGCTTPGEAAHKLNQKLFPLLKAHYSTERKKPDQSPMETIESGKATCSGLSILLVEACRAVGIPARVAGTPMWTNMRGNHTWTEVWNDGWHFVGASEPDPAGLDHGWFTGDASKAIKDKTEHAIYASSFKRTGISFPLVWAEDIKWVPAENVTDRYTLGAAGKPADSAMAKVLVKVLNTHGRRVVTDVTFAPASQPLEHGLSKGETADLNDLVAFQIERSCPPRKVTLSATVEGQLLIKTVMAGAEAEQLVTLQAETPAEASLTHLLTDRFGSDLEKRKLAAQHLATIKPDSHNCAQAWDAYRAAPVHEELRKQFEQKIVSTADRTSPYLWRHVGTKPATGWALVIAMHGGGGVPKQVNDGEWNYMFSTYYREHPEAGGYVYLALRAPNDVWNGFYDDAISPLIEALIKQFVLFDGVDPNRVYVCGASHGGYGAYVIGPKIPWRFAAVHAAASAVTPGETRGENLRNVRFTSMVGALDSAYGRIELGRKFQKQMTDLQSKYGGYDSELIFPERTGHLVPDHDWVVDMQKHTRQTLPSKLIWTQSDTMLKRFYWLEAAQPVPDGHIEATAEGNKVALILEKQEKVSLALRPGQFDLSKPLLVSVNGGAPVSYPVKPSLEVYCADLEQTADPVISALARVNITADKK